MIWSVTLYAVETVQRQDRLQRRHREVAQTERYSRNANSPWRKLFPGNGSSGTAYASQNECIGIASKLVECGRI